MVLPLFKSRLLIIVSAQKWLVIMNVALRADVNKTRSDRPDIYEGTQYTKRHVNLCR